jgi:hypothetical protein
VINENAHNMSHLYSTFTFINLVDNIYIILTLTL